MFLPDLRSLSGRFSGSDRPRGHRVFPDVAKVVPEGLRVERDCEEPGERSRSVFAVMKIFYDLRSCQIEVVEFADFKFENSKKTLFTCRLHSTFRMIKSNKMT